MRDIDTYPKDQDNPYNGVGFQAKCDLQNNITLENVKDFGYIGGMERFVLL